MKEYVVLALLLPATLNAQARTAVSAYVASDPGLANNPLLIGGTFAREHGIFATRGSLGLDVTTAPVPTADSLAAPTSGIGSADFDGLLYIGNPRGGTTLIPYALAGIGIRGVRADGIGIAANYSYGGGFRAPFGRGFSFEGEARYRKSFAETLDRPDRVVGNGMEFRAALNVGFGGRSAVPRPGNVPAFPRPVGVPTPSGPFATAPRTSGLNADTRLRVASATIQTAERYIGVPYLWGGNTPQTGFDCSGFIRYVYDLNGVSVPRVSQDQARFGNALPLEIGQFQVGDLLAFASNGRDVDHTALYAGGGRIIHSSSSGSGVRYDDLGSSRGRWFLEHLVAARRVIDAGLPAGAGSAR
ncbi:MAG: hypothetical protein GEU90_05195 [Gemmatimonas sp.]|nr:hypothetical protein [Gemmatimonas sp.]